MRVFALFAILLVAVSATALGETVSHNASQIRNGTFGSAVGTGNYTFPNSLVITNGLGIGAAHDSATMLQIDNPLGGSGAPFMKFKQSGTPVFASYLAGYEGIHLSALDATLVPSILFDVGGLGNTKMIISSAGTLSVNKTSYSSYALDVGGNISGTALCIGSDCRNAWPTGGGEGGGGGWVDDGTVVRLNTSTDSVGIGTAVPSYKLDVVGRARFQPSGSYSAGIWFTNSTVGDKVLLGMYNNTIVGLYSAQLGYWPFTMDITNGRIGVSSVPSSYVFSVDKVSYISDSTGWDMFVNNYYNATRYGRAYLGNSYYGQGIQGQGSQYGVYGVGVTSGVYGSGTGNGVVGTGAYGVQGVGTDRGVQGQGTNYGVVGYVASGAGIGVYGVAPQYGTYGQGSIWGVHGYDTDSPSGASHGYLGYGGYGVYGTGYDAAVYGQHSSGYTTGVLGFYSAGTLVGVYGQGPSGHYDFYAGGPGVDYGSSSSIRWKDNITPITGALNKVLNMRGVYFDWDAAHGGQHDMGMVAEEVGKQVPEVVVWDKNSTDENGSHYASGMDYGRLTPILVEAVKEQQKQIDSLKADNAAMKLVICKNNPKEKVCK